MKKALSTTIQQKRKTAQRPRAALSVVERHPTAQSLRDLAYESIKHRIITCEFKPGEYINEARVSAILGLGRTPVHQAIDRLMLDGMVEVIPRKGVIELIGLFEAGEGEVELEFGRNHLRVRRGEVMFTSKLIDGRFPDYEAVIPIGADKEVELERDALRAALQRAAILSNEKYRGVRLEVSPGKLCIMAHNPEQEEAVEELEAQTSVDDLAVGFNVGYLMDALGALAGDKVKVNLRDAQSSCLLQASEDDRIRHVIMPLRL